MPFTAFSIRHKRKLTKTCPPVRKALLIMKLIAVLLFVASMQVFAEAHSQTVNLSLKNAPFQKVLKEIRKQTGYNFICTVELMEMVGKVSVDAKNAHGKHLLYDGMNAPEDRIQIIKPDDPISKYADKYGIAELWYVKVDSSSAEIGSAYPSTALKPVGLPNLEYTCYLTTLVQIIFWVIPLRKRLIESELSNRDSKKIQTNHFRCTRG